MFFRIIRMLFLHSFGLHIFFYCCFYICYFLIEFIYLLGLFLGIYGQLFS